MSSSAPRSTRLQTAYKVIEGYSTLSVPEMLKPLSDSSYTYVILPESLGMPSRHGKDEFGAQAAGITKIFKNFRMVPQMVLEAPEQNSVIVHARMEGELNMGLGEWVNECMMVMEMSEDGTKVVKHTEFVDSAKAKKLREMLAGAMGGQKANSVLHDMKES